MLLTGRCPVLPTLTYITNTTMIEISIAFNDTNVSERCIATCDPNQKAILAATTQICNGYGSIDEAMPARVEATAIGECPGYEDRFLAGFACPFSVTINIDSIEE